MKPKSFFEELTNKEYWKRTIGRKEYFSVGILLSIVQMFGFFAMTHEHLPTSLIGFIIFIFSLFAFTNLIIMRLNDLQLEWQFIFIIFIPLINIAFGLYLVFAPGQTKSINTKNKSSIDEKDIPKILNEYNQLKNDGIITHEEFTKKKNKLLNNSNNSNISSKNVDENSNTIFKRVVFVINNIIIRMYYHDIDIENIKITTTLEDIIKKDDSEVEWNTFLYGLECEFSIKINSNKKFTTINDLCIYINKKIKN